ncbi:MAG TPA: branched-chain amino acid ABC transporter substrate-binding protein [Pirellulales bacterium]
MPMVRWVCAAVLCCAAVIFAASSVSAKTIKIVSSLPRTGSAKPQTDTMVNAIRLALDEVGYKVGDFTITYKDLDDATASAGQATDDQEMANALEAANDQDVMAYIGPYNSGVARGSMRLLNQAGLLMISPANTAVGLTKPGLGEKGEPKKYRPSGKINYFRVVPADDLQGDCAAQWARDMDMKKVYVLDDKTAYGKGLADIFEKRAKALGLSIVGRDSLEPNTQEFRSKITQILSKEPDLVYFGGTTQTKGGQFCKELYDADFKGKLMVPDGCMENAFIDAAGPKNANDHVYVTFGGVVPSKLTGAGKEFVDKYKAKYGNMPEAYALYAYEATKVVLDAIRKAGVKDREAILQAARQTKDFPGALGTWSFDENGDTTLKKLSGSVVHDGQFEFVKMLGDDSDKK